MQSSVSTSDFVVTDISGTINILRAYVIKGEQAIYGDRIPIYRKTTNKFSVIFGTPPISGHWSDETKDEVIPSNECLSVLCNADISDEFLPSQMT